MNANSNGNKTVGKSNKVKSWIFKNFNKIDKSTYDSRKNRKSEYN